MEDPYFNLGLQRYIEIQKVLVEHYSDTLQKQAQLYEPLPRNLVYMDFVSKGKAKEFRELFVKNHWCLEDMERCGDLEKALADHDYKTLMKALRGELK